MRDIGTSRSQNGYPSQWNTGDASSRPSYAHPDCSRRSGSAKKYAVVVTVASLDHKHQRTNLRGCLLLWRCTNIRTELNVVKS